MPENYHHGNLRERLIEEAVIVLNEESPEKLSLRALARKIGVSHAAPLRHFKTKTDLLGALAEEGIGRLLQTTIEAQKAAPDDKRLLNMAFTYVKWARENPAFYQAMRSPEVLRYASPELTERLTRFADMQRKEIARAQEQGWRSDQDVDVLFFHLVSLTAGTALVVTDDAYRAPMPGKIGSDAIRDSLAYFLDF